MTPGLALDSGEFIPASELNRRIDVNAFQKTIEDMIVRIRTQDDQIKQLTASLETASSAVIVLKQQQREGWAQLASGQQPVAWWNEDGVRLRYSDTVDVPRGTPLYLHPAPAQQPLSDEMDEMRAKVQKHKEHIRLCNDIISNHCIAMQAALIEQSTGKGDEAALEWISNTLDGPGLLPSCAEAAQLPDAKEKGPAQAWFDAKTEEHEAMRARQDVEHGKVVKP